MDLIEFVNNEIFILPKSRKEFSFLPFLKTCFNEYLELLDSLAGSDDITKKVIESKHIANLLCENILTTVDSYLLGHINLSYNTLHSCIDNAITYVNNLTKSPDLNTKYLDSNIIDIHRLYRARVTDNIFLSPCDMFHIPFDKRHLVSTQRYSIPGLPCLYLGSSIFICWRELGSDNLDKLAISSSTLLDS